MADDQDAANPVEQLLELMVYAPIGFIYEYQDVLPKLIKRGKSQVQLARVFGQLASMQGRSAEKGQSAENAQSAEKAQSAAGGIDLASVVSLASSAAARVLTDIGAQIGLAPAGPASPSKSAEPETTSSSAAEAADEEAEGPDSAGPTGPLPIAGYDRLKARDIIPLLNDLSEAQRDRIQAHEAAGRNRKTVLAKLDRLRD